MTSLLFLSASTFYKDLNSLDEIKDNTTAQSVALMKWSALLSCDGSSVEQKDRLSELARHVRGAKSSAQRALELQHLRRLFQNRAALAPAIHNGLRDDLQAAGIACYNNTTLNAVLNALKDAIEAGNDLDGLKAAGMAVANAVRYNGTIAGTGDIIPQVDGATGFGQFLTGYKAPVAAGSPVSDANPLRVLDAAIVLDAGYVPAISTRAGAIKTGSGNAVHTPTPADTEKLELLDDIVAAADLYANVDFPAVVTNVNTQLQGAGSIEAAILAARGILTYTFDVPIMIHMHENINGALAFQSKNDDVNYALLRFGHKAKIALAEARAHVDAVAVFNEYLRQALAATKALTGKAEEPFTMDEKLGALATKIGSEGHQPEELGDFVDTVKTTLSKTGDISASLGALAAQVIADEKAQVLASGTGQIDALVGWLNKWNAEVLVAGGDPSAIPFLRPTQSLSFYLVSPANLGAVADGYEVLLALTGDQNFALPTSVTRYLAGAAARKLTSPSGAVGEVANAKTLADVRGALPVKDVSGYYLLSSDPGNAARLAFLALFAS